MKVLSTVIVLIFLSFISICSVTAKVYLSCELAKSLSRSSVDRTLIPHYICLAKAASQSNTTKTTLMPNKSSSYGIFQINDKDECGKDRRSGTCNIKCSDLIDDDIRDDIACARKIVDTKGFKNWKQWESKCKSTTTAVKNNALPNLTNCDY